MRYCTVLYCCQNDVYHMQDAMRLGDCLLCARRVSRTNRHAACCATAAVHAGAQTVCTHTHTPYIAMVHRPSLHLTQTDLPSYEGTQMACTNTHRILSCFTIPRYIHITETDITVQFCWPGDGWHPMYTRTIIYILYILYILYASRPFCRFLSARRAVFVFVFVLLGRDFAFLLCFPKFDAYYYCYP